MVQAWGEGANDIVDILTTELQKLPTSQVPEIKGTFRPRLRGLVTVSTSIEHSLTTQAPEADSKAEKPALNQLQFTAQSDLPDKSEREVFVSFAWGDDSSLQARQRTEVVDRLCQRLRQEGWNILRDSNTLLPGQLISGFMKRIGLADRIIVVLSDKYLHSPYCMTDSIGFISDRSEKRRTFCGALSLTLEDARISTRADRLAYAGHWKQEFERLDADIDDPVRRWLLGEGAFAECRAMREWYTHLSDMLRYINDVLHPHGFDAILENNFASLHQMLQQRVANHAT